MQTDDVMTINVGGTAFATLASTLGKSPTLLTLIATAPRDHNHVPFLDRDPRLFSMLLYYLRYGSLPPTIPAGGAAHDELTREAGFYGISLLSANVEADGVITMQSYVQGPKRWHSRGSFVVKLFGTVSDSCVKDIKTSSDCTIAPGSKSTTKVLTIEVPLSWNKGALNHDATLGFVTRICQILRTHGYVLTTCTKLENEFYSAGNGKWFFAKL
jgi:hypothetical protein